MPADAGEEVFFLTGTDEHGQKVEKGRRRRGSRLKRWRTKLSPTTHDIFQHASFTTTASSARPTLTTRMSYEPAFQRLLDSGDIYKATYKGLYSVSDRAFVTGNQAKELQAQGLAHQLVELEEKTYNFRLSKYEKPLLVFAAHPGLRAAPIPLQRGEALRGETASEI
ncbi:MAG: class I tRNA ligase family protein [Holophagaceae bacterium]|nr:class I tRNA ligase family protein [Holophagaceae bacterium]